MKAFIEAECPKCQSHIGWCGTLANKPACRRCGFRESQAELNAAEAKMNQYLSEIGEQREREKAAEWNARTPDQERWYSEGQAAADTAATRGLRKTLPLDVPSPYVATKTTDGKFHAEPHRWWLWGWRDAEWNRDRRKQQEDVK